MPRAFEKENLSFFDKTTNEVNVSSTYRTSVRFLFLCQKKAKRQPAVWICFQRDGSKIFVVLVLTQFELTDIKTSMI